MLPAQTLCVIEQDYKVVVIDPANLQRIYDRVYDSNFAGFDFDFFLFLICFRRLHRPAQTLSVNAQDM